MRGGNALRGSPSLASRCLHGTTLLLTLLPGTVLLGTMHIDSRGMGIRHITLPLMRIFRV